MAAQTASNFDNLSSRATAARQSNDVPGAIGLYKEALKENPKWAEGWWYLGSLAYDADRYTEGRDALARLVQLDPNATPAWALLGLCEFETGDYVDSLEHIKRGLAAASVDPKMEGVLRYHQALLLTHDGQFDKAITAYLWFARRGVQNPELTSAIGLAALHAPLLPKEIKPGERELFQTAGQAAYFSMTGQFADAQAALAGLITRFPNAHYVHYLYGCFLMAVKPDLALQELQRELEVTPSSGPTHAMIAFLMLQQGDAATARPHAEAAVKEDPGSAMTQHVLGRCLLEEGKAEAALPHLKLAEEKDPANLDVHVCLAAAYSRAARPKEAREERLRSLALWKEKDAVANP